MTCPNCGEDFDVITTPGKDDHPDEYDYYCHIGTSKPNGKTVLFYHTKA